MMNPQIDFITALTRELRSFQDETTWIFWDTTKDMLTRAAAAVIAEGELPRIVLRCEYDPADLACWTILEVDGEYVTTLAADDVAVLRALLMTWDENRPAQLGGSLSTPTRLADGRIVTEIVPELLKGKEGEE
jgi:hypothetical protein